MKKILLFSSLLLLVACSSGEGENQEDVDINEKEESSAVSESNNNGIEVGELVEESYSITQSELEGAYEYNDKEKTTEVSFEDGGTLRIKDGSGDLRYHVNEEYGRVVIDGVVHRVNKMENGYELISIDREGKRTNNDIQLTDIE